MVEAVKRVVTRVEPRVEKKVFPGPLLDDDFDILDPLTKLSRKLVENASDFFSDFVFIHR